MTEKSTERSVIKDKSDNDEVILSDLVSISNKKMDTNTIKPNQYISTENMKQNFLGITFLDELPKTDKITEFCEKDILISNIRPYLKKIWLSNFSGGCSSDIIVLHPHNKEDAEFIYYSLTTDKFINYMMKTSKGTKMPRGDKKAILKFKLRNHPFEFKNNVIQLATHLDNKIALMEKKYNYLFILKDYLLKNMFCNKNDIPNIRFPGFNEKWELKKIGDISKTYSGGTPKTSKKEYYKGDIPFIKSGEINNDKTEQHITKEAILNSSAKYVKKGDLLLALYGATSGEVAISRIDGAINQAVLKIDNPMNVVFQYNLFLKSKEQIIFKYIQGGQGNLSAKIIKNLSFKYPKMNEQNKISNFLSIIDKKIVLLNQEIELNKKFKNTLLSKMFC